MTSDVKSRVDFGAKIDAEPWVVLPDGHDLAKWEKQDEVAYNQNNRQTEKYKFFVKAFDYLKDNQIAGDYYEFGCHRVRTFRMALSEARRHDLNDMRFHAFDSFEGLPTTISDPSKDLWHQPGALSTSVETFRGIIDQHGIYTDKIETVQGFYNETLTPDLIAQYKAAGSKIALVNIDCDLYESANSVFPFIDELLQDGALIYIDDMFVGYRGSPFRGVARSFLEYQKTSRFKFLRHMDIGWWGRSYIAYQSDASTEHLDVSLL